MANSTHETPGVVIRKIYAKESDTIVTALSRKLGKIGCVARGARNSKKRFMGGIDLFDCGKFEIKEPARSNSLFTITSLSEKQSWPKLSENLIRLHLASYSAEITLLYCEEEDHECGKLFDPLFLTFKRINNIESFRDSYLAAHFYNLYLLYFCGYDPTEASITKNKNILSWWNQMLEANKPISVEDNLEESSAMLKESFALLSYFTEHTAGKRIATKNEFLLDNAC